MDDAEVPTDDEESISVLWRSTEATSVPVAAEESSAARAEVARLSVQGGLRWYRCCVPFELTALSMWLPASEEKARRKIRATVIPLWRRKIGANEKGLLAWSQAGSRGGAPLAAASAALPLPFRSS